MKVPQSAKKMIPRTCSVCGKRLKSKEYLVYHIDKAHKSMIPKDWSAARYENYLRTGKTHGNCLICNEDTEWNETTWKYKRICDKKSCNDEIAKKAKANMVKKYGKEHLLNDPDMQRKMVYAKHTSGLYEWDDEEYKKTYIPYASQMEYKFLEMLNGFLNLDPTDVIGPSPNTYQYKYKGEIHQYIPDYYIPSLNLEIEIKEPKDNQNQHPKIQAVDKVKENLKDKVMESNKKVHYIKVNGTDYSEFLELFMYLKMDNTVPKNEAKTVTESVSVIENLINELPVMETSVKSNIDKDFKPKGKKSLKDFKRVKITKDVIMKYRSEIKMLKHINPDCESYLYFDGDEPVGVVSVEAKDRDDGTRWIQAIEVLSKYQGYGLGNQLLDVAVKELKGNSLSVNVKNEVAKKMYEKYGFKASKESITDVKTGKKSVYFMYLPSVLTESNVITRHVLDLDNKCTLDGKPVDIIKSDEYCPVKLANIPNYMGINLCSVHSVEWSELPDGQLIDVTVKFSPANSTDIIESSIMESVITEGSKVLEKKNGYDLAVLSARISQNAIDLYDKKFNDYKSVRKRITGMINDSTYTTAPLVRDHLTMIRNNLALTLKQKNRSNEWYDAQKLLKDMDTLYLPKINKKIQILANSNNAYVTEGFDEANSYFVQESFITGELGNTVFRPVYIFLSFTFSPLAKIIKKVTSQEFSHSSIAFDSGLKDLCSFGTDPDTGRMGFCAFENIKAGLYKNPNAYYALYVYLAPEMEYIAIKDAVEKFKQRADELRYSVAGLANILFGKETNYKNEWFCSEFVANVMSIGNPKLFEKYYSLYTPGDLAKIIQFTEVDSGKIIKYDEKKVNRKVKKLLAERGFTNVKTRKN